MNAEAPATGSHSSGYGLLFLFGLVVGVLATALAMRAIKARHEPFPGSVMQVMEKQFSLLDGNIASNR
ncbi:MAG: hypothetical protein ABI538_09885 [Pseudoxanthomonas sp.]